MMMTNEDLNFFGEKLNDYWDAIDSATDEAIIKILDHYGLDIDYVRAHPDEFTLYEKPTYTPCDFIKHCYLVYSGNTLGSFTLHSYLDMDKQQIQSQFTYEVNHMTYTLGGDL